MRTYSVLAPTTVTASRGNRACAPNTLPVRRWHARQWHTDTRTGSPTTCACNCPQLHAATREDWGDAGCIRAPLINSLAIGMAILFVSLDLAKPRGHTARRAP